MRAVRGAVRDRGADAERQGLGHRHATARPSRSRAAPVRAVVDTTGAGDLYAAGFLYGLTHGSELAACGRLGSLCAAEIIAHFGARPETSLKELAAKAGLV